MLAGLPSSASWRPRRKQRYRGAVGSGRGDKKGGGKKTQAYTLRKYFTCASDVLSTAASSGKTNVRRNDPFLAYFLELYVCNEDGRKKFRAK